MKKVVIDARLSGLQHAGIGRYIQSLVERLETIDRGRDELEGLEGKEGAINILSVRSGPRHYSLAEQLRFPAILRNLRPDLAHFPHFNVPLLYNSPFVVTIHDLLWHEQIGITATTLPAGIYWLKYLGYRLVLRHAILKSKAIIVPSNWVKKKVAERFPQAEKKIRVIYEGVSEAFKGPTLRRAQDRTSFDFPYIIYTGSLYPHKNVSIILDALKHFNDLKLVVACARSAFGQRFEKEVEKKGVKGKVIFAGFVPDEELAALYSKAVAMVFPSLSEGFGLPGLEAMAAGCPVISSNAGALPEIYANAATYFDPMDKDDLIKKIREIRGNKGYGGKMIKLGRDRAVLFSWDKCAEETMRIYQDNL